MHGTEKKCNTVIYIYKYLSIIYIYKYLSIIYIHKYLSITVSSS